MKNVQVEEVFVLGGVRDQNKDSGRKPQEAASVLARGGVVCILAPGRQPESCFENPEGNLNIVPPILVATC